MGSHVIGNPWNELRRFTRARIALGRTGDSLPTQAVLEFGLAHAQARDAVHHPLDVAVLAAALETNGLASLTVTSAAADRAQYLLRPDFGRRLHASGVATLEWYRQDAERDDTPADLFGRINTPTNTSTSKGTSASPGTSTGTSTSASTSTSPSTSASKPTVVFVIADGLSAFAPQRHALPLLGEVLPRLDEWTIGPVVIATQSRVALGDEIGGVLGADAVVMLIGERPGLSSPDSLGIYVTWQPRVGRTDAERNCISNVRPEGLGYDAAAHKLHYLLTRARSLGATGIALKDESEPGTFVADDLARATT